MSDTFGDRMKFSYEDRTRFLLPRRTYTIIRLDGKAFHTYTKNLKKPFDSGLYEDIDKSIIAILSHIQGSVLAYTQSDEISILLTDFKTPTTDAWFDGNVQKMSSISASMLTAKFNQLRSERQVQYALNNDIDFAIGDEWPLAYFDSRVFTIPDRTEVMNYFRWRQQDCIRNSVSMVAQSNFSHKELQGKSQSDMHDMLHNKGVNWATGFTDGEKNGRLVVKETYVVDFKPIDVSFVSPSAVSLHTVGATRTKWVSKDAWVFTKDEGKLLDMIPKYE